MSTISRKKSTGYKKGGLISLFLLVVAIAPAQAQTITWKKVWSTQGGGAPNNFFNGYHDIHYDPFTGKTWLWSTSSAGGPESIYSTRWHYFDSTAAVDTLFVDGGQSASWACKSNSESLPGTRHPVGQIWLDTQRNRIWLMQGVCLGNIQPDMYYLQLSNPPSPTGFKQVFPAHLPVRFNQAGPKTMLTAPIISPGQSTINVLSGSAIKNGMYLQILSERMLVVSGGLTPTLTVLRGQLNTTPLKTIRSNTVVDTVSGMFNNASIVHDSDDDAFFLLGTDGGDNSHSMQVYCDTSLNRGVLTASQKQVGCSLPDDWNDLTAAMLANGPLPTGLYYPNLEYDAVHHVLIQSMGLAGCCTPENQTWTYKPRAAAKKWTNANPLNPPVNSSSNNEGGRVAHAMVNGKYYYHLTAHTPSYGTPPAKPPEDWVYDPGKNTWTRLSAGQGPELTESMTYDKTHNRLIAWATKVDSDGLYRATGIAEIWEGEIH